MFSPSPINKPGTSLDVIHSHIHLIISKFLPHMMNSQGWPAVLPHRPFWSTTFARDLRWGGIWFVREVIILGFALWKRKENEMGLDVMTLLPTPPAAGGLCASLQTACDSAPANSRSWSPSMDAILLLLYLLQKTHTHPSRWLCVQKSWAGHPSRGKAKLRFRDERQ